MVNKRQEERKKAKEILEKVKKFRYLSNTMTMDDFWRIAERYANAQKTADVYFAKKILAVFEEQCWLLDLREQKITEEEFYKKIEMRAYAEIESKMKARQKHLGKKNNPKGKR